MSKLHIGGLTIGSHYKSLPDAVSASHAGDTIVIHKHHIKLEQAITIDHDLYLEGTGSTSVDIADHLAGIVLVNGQLHLKHLNFNVGQSNAIIAAPQATAELDLMDCHFSHPRKLNAREYFPLVSIVEAPQVTIVAHQVTIPYVNINCQSIDCTQAMIGDAVRATSMVQATHGSLNQVTFKNTFVNGPMQARDIKITNNVTFQNVGSIEGLVTVNVTVEKKANKIKQQFGQVAKQYGLHLIGDTTVTQGVLNSNDLIASPVYAQDGTMTFKDCQLAAGELACLAVNSALVFDNCVDKNDWSLQHTMVSNRHSQLQIKTTQQDALDKLNAMIGLAPVKKQINELIATSDVNAKLQAQGQPAAMPVMHMVFAGNAGTGKTTVARLVAQALYEHGVLATNKFSETSAKDLVAGYRGQSSQKTADVIENALGGVLFIDEAYQLHSDNNGNDFENAAVDELIAQMENHRDNLVVIMAGYTSDMTNFFNEGNQGLQSRFKNWIEFPDYSTDELSAIGMKLLAAQNIQFANDMTQQTFTQAINQLAGQTSGNGRFVRNFVESIIGAKNVRVARSGDDQLLTIVNDDVTNAAHEMQAQVTRFE